MNDEQTPTTKLTSADVDAMVMNAAMKHATGARPPRLFQEWAKRVDV